MALSSINTCNSLFTKTGKGISINLYSFTENSLTFKYNLGDEDIQSITSQVIAVVSYTTDSINKLLTINTLTVNVLYNFTVTTTNNNIINISGTPKPLYELTNTKDYDSSNIRFSNIDFPVHPTARNNDSIASFAVSYDGNTLIFSSSSSSATNRGIWYSMLTGNIWLSSTSITKTRYCPGKMKFTEDNTKVFMTSYLSTGSNNFVSYYSGNRFVTETTIYSNTSTNYVYISITPLGETVIVSNGNSTNILYFNKNQAGGGYSAGSTLTLQIYINDIDFYNNGSKMYIVSNYPNYHVYYADWSSNQIQNISSNILSGNLIRIASICSTKNNNLVTVLGSYTPDYRPYYIDPLNNTKTTLYNATVKSFCSTIRTFFGEDEIYFLDSENNVCRMINQKNYYKTIINNYNVIFFLNDNIIKFNRSITAEVLIVGAGGSGGGAYDRIFGGGGGGAGSVGIGTFTFIANTTYIITIGKGVSESNGSNTTLKIGNTIVLEAKGGGKGMSISRSPVVDLAGDGGSGGGASKYNTQGGSVITNTSYSNITFYGNNGGNFTSNFSSGGGGAGSPGLGGSTGAPNTGGSGKAWSIISPDKYYGRGGDGNLNGNPSYIYLNGRPGYPSNSGNGGGGGRYGGIGADGIFAFAYI